VLSQAAPLDSESAYPWQKALALADSCVLSKGD
jgi:hypothetical protein